LLWLNP